MEKIDRTLIDFALRVLWTMRDHGEWDSDTMQSIADAAELRDLTSTTNGVFDLPDGLRERANVAMGFDADYTPEHMTDEEAA